MQLHTVQQGVISGWGGQHTQLQFACYLHVHAPIAFLVVLEFVVAVHSCKTIEGTLSYVCHPVTVRIHLPGVVGTRACYEGSSLLQCLVVLGAMGRCTVEANPQHKLGAVRVIH